MAGQRTRHFFLLAAGGLWLAGCVPGTSGSNTPVAADGQPIINATVTAPTQTKMVAQDVEAPDIFHAAGLALWDGRPSLGGVWVASPDAKNPERVIIRNPANGKFVIGALFQREADLPGPALQISSDAAVALGILAGNPVRITVTALKRVEAPPPKPAAKPPLATAGAATAAAQGGPTSQAAQTAPPPRPASIAAAAAPVAAAAATAAAPAKPAPVTLSPVKVSPVAPLSTSEVTAGAAKAIDSAAAAQPASPAAQKPPQARPVAPAATGPEVQIGIFSTEAYALRAVGILAKHGVVARISVEQSHGKTYWRVTARGDQATLARVKSAGFKDAYILK